MAENYTIDDIRESTALDERGNLVPVYVVYYTTKSGSKLSIEVPKDQFSLERAEELVKSEADKIESIYDL